MISLLIILVGILLLASVIYFVVTFFSRIVLRHGKGTGKFEENKGYNNFTIAFSLVVSFIFGCYYVFSNPAHNYKTAYIESTQKKYIVTIYSKKNLMGHDPFTVLLRRTYLDSAKFELSKCNGIIDGTEVTYKNTYFKFQKGSNIVINDGSLKVGLEYFDSFYSKKSELYLNGQYKLEWRK